MKSWADLKSRHRTLESLHCTELQPLCLEQVNLSNRARQNAKVRTPVRVDRDVDAGLADHTKNENTPRQRKRGDDVRHRVLTAALECFGSSGFEGTSTRTVATRAHVTHTLVIYHFQSKDQLWIATMERALSQYTDALKAQVYKTHEGTPRAAFAAFIEQFVRMSSRFPQIHRILTMESNQNTERLKWIIKHYLRDHFNTVRGLIRRGQDEGSVRQCDPARLYYLIISAGGTPFTIATEYRAFTGRDVFSEAEILRNIAFIYEIVFV
jgi:TetR/AcrR family transcriptional regulator